MANKYITHWRSAFSLSGAMFASLFWVSTGTLVAPTKAEAVQCGSYDGFFCSGTASQYAGGFNPGTGYGGFGGGNCSASKTPVIFIHGNGDNATSWGAPPGNVTGYTTPPRSVYEEMKARGYNDCELFGVTYLSDSERMTSAAADNYMQPSKYNIITDFIKVVKAYTGKSQVDIVTHSLGVSQTLAALKYNNMWGSVRKFVNIAGGLKGLYSCYYAGYANPLAPTCGSQNWFDSYTFGFFPEGWYWGVWVSNSWTGSGSSNSMRSAPSYYSAIQFYTISAGTKDEIACTTASFWVGCDQTNKFNSASNVMSQILVGAGSDAAQVDWDWSDYSPYNMMGGDSSNGVGHFRAARNTGAIIQRMLLTTCTGLDCAADYSYGPKANY